MIGIQRNIIWTLKILFFFTLFASCKVFETPTYTLNEAIDSKKGVKLKIKDKGPYFFHQLIIINEQLYGLIPKKNSNKKWLDFKIVDDNYLGKYKLLEIEENSIQDLKKPLSPTGTILVGALLIGLIVTGLAL